jgi:hypothetical protein
LLLGYLCESVIWSLVIGEISMANVEQPNPSQFWDIFANRSSGQFPEGTPIDLIANSANYQYGNPYPELDDEGIGIHPITKRDQGGLSFNTNLGASMQIRDLDLGPIDRYDENKDNIQVGPGSQQYTSDGSGESYQQPAEKGGGFLDIIKNPIFIIGGGLAIAAIILLKK